MIRYRIGVAALGVLLAVPGPAPAFFPFHRPWFAPPVYGPPAYEYAYPSYYYAPVPVYPQPLVYAGPCMPVYGLPLTPPQVYPVAPAATPRAEARAPATPKPTAVKPPPVAETTIPPAAPSAVRPAAGIAVEAPVPAPSSDLPLLKLPSLPGVTDPKSPGSGPALPSAVPSPAPSPAAPSDTIPKPTTEPTPSVPTPKLPSKSDDTLPPLVLPPDGLSGPSGIVPTPSISRSSPISNGVTAQVFPASGTAPVGDTRKVGFFNHTDTDIALVVEGRSVKLPRKTYIQAVLPPTFTWKYADRPAATATVPTGAAGLDVLFRE